MPTTLLKFRIGYSTGEEGGGRWSQTAVVLLGEHMQEVLASMIGLDDSSNWGYRCCHKEHL